MITILSYDDHENHHRHLKRQMRKTIGLEFKRVRNYREAIDCVSDRSIDCVVTDDQLAGGGGIRLFKALRSRQCMIPFIFFSDDLSEGEQCLQPGRYGEDEFNIAIPFLRIDLLVTWIFKLVESHRMHVERGKLKEEIYRCPPEEIAELESKLAKLTEREVEILELLASGSSNKEIAEDLGISFHTVVTHIRHIFEKLEVRSRAEAVKFALSIRLTERH